MDSIDFEVIKQLIEEKYPDKKEYTENLRLLYKRYMNSFYTPCTSKYFYFYKKKLIMRITLENYKDIIPEKNQRLIESLLIDLLELNTELENIQEPYRKLYIDYITEHTEYSPERVDPCPDFYGMYKLVFEKNPYESVGTEMTIDELDSAMCILINFVEFKLS